MVFDKVSIGLSLLCSLHCLAIPLLALLLPTASALSLENEGLHNILLALVLPISCSALFIGYKQHKNLNVLLIGIVGLIILCTTFWLGHAVLGEVVEKSITIMASLLIMYSHYLNYTKCLSDVDCSCHSENKI